MNQLTKFYIRAFVLILLVASIMYLGILMKKVKVLLANMGSAIPGCDYEIINPTIYNGRLHRTFFYKSDDIISYDRSR